MTVIDVEENLFTVGVIPSTLKLTTLGDLKVGDMVNLETDIIGKYIERFLRGPLSSSGERQNDLTWEKLARYGWS
ncbi:MAG: hypothetical protein ABC360_01065 [Acetomicrobium sp.]